MQTTDFIIQSDIKFLTNSSLFNEQPIFVISSNKSLTGGEFIAVYRIRNSRHEGTSGLMGVTWGSTAGLISVTGSKPIYPQSVSAENNTTTASQNSYRISTIVNSNDQLNVIVEDTNLFFGDITITGLNRINEFKYIGTGYRPDPDTLPTNGNTGSSQVLLYTYNRNELSSSLTSVADRSGNSLSAHIKGSASGTGTTATVTGWSYSPCDGGFRLDGNGYIESMSSNLFNGSLYTGYTIMTHAKLSLTGNTSIMTIGSGTTVMMSIMEKNGTLEAKIGVSSITAGYINAGSWNHFAVTVITGTASNSGTWIYINGQSAAVSATMNSLPSLSATGRLLIGKDMNLTASGLTGSIGLTRVFNRSLSSSEIFHNYIATIPAMHICDSIKIG